MQTTPLAELYRERGQPLEPYCGSLTRATGGESAVLPPRWPARQVVLYDASWRAPIRVEGPDARKWLNGMITANVRDLAPGRWAPSFQLDPKGHILASFDIACCAADAFVILVSEDQRAALLDRLRRFVFVSKLTLDDMGERWSALQVRGPRAAEVWAATGQPEANMTPGMCAAPAAADDATVLLLAAAPGAVAQLEVYGSPLALAAWWPALEPLCLCAGAAVCERDRILSRLPRYGVDITAGELPQETGQLDRLDFTKGCYVGQEIVERIRARGAVHRHWVSVALGAFATPGTALEADGRSVGRLTSVAASDGGWLGLGYLHEPYHQPRTPVRAGAAEGQVEA